jgi:SAM-dependent methyltransferase
MSNPFDNKVVASGYEAWSASRGRRADRLEKQLLAEQLAAFPCGATVLEVGCGTGHFTRWLAECGLRVVGDSVGERLSRLHWRTTLWPVPGIRSLRLPWGGFIGMLAQLRPMRNGMIA